MLVRLWVAQGGGHPIGAAEGAFGVAVIQTRCRDKTCWVAAEAASQNAEVARLLHGALRLTAPLQRLEEIRVVFRRDLRQGRLRILLLALVELPQRPGQNVIVVPRPGNAKRIAL